MYGTFAELLKQKGLSAYKVAQETGVEQATLSRWKNGKSTPSVETLQLLADYFGVSLDYLLGHTPAKNPPADENRDIQAELEAIMGGLNTSTGLMLDGKPASQEALESLRYAIEMGLTHARKVNAEKRGKK